MKEGDSVFIKGGSKSGRRLLSLRWAVVLTVFLAGAPLALFIAVRHANAPLAERFTVLSLAALFALIMAAMLAFQILNFVETLQSASRRWQSGDLQFRILPRRFWNREFRELAAQQNETASRLNALYQREKEIAVTLQQMLVSPLPSRWKAYWFADYYRAGSSDADVGGDFYALFDLPDGRLGLLFGDIGGRGLEAAVKIASLRYTLEAYAREGMEPEEMMARANGVVCEAEFQIVTLVYIILNSETGELAITNAGHEPLLHWSAERREWRTLNNEQPALGVISGSAYQSFRLFLHPHDLLLLYTDGVASVGPKQGDWSTEDLLERVRALSIGTPDDVIREVSGHLPPGEDDAALAALQWMPSPGREKGIPL
jgi:serine phosphatase RsbU (regulator of sigma subunit)